VAKLFFLLSGENETLPAAELLAILEAESIAFEVKEKLDQVVRLDAAQNSIKAVHQRAAYTRISALELFTCKAQETEIMKTADSANFKSVLSEGESFAVRIRRVKEYAEKVGTVALEGKLGKHILHNTVKTKVNLKAPDKTFFGVLTNDRLVFGVKLTEIEPKTFSERRPRKKPFFHPSAMPSKLARCMVNLARAKAGELVLEPFCGTGSVMVEAALVGCRVLGFDVQRRMVVGCRKNLKHFSLEPEGLVIADARRLPLTRIDHLVTDPPYGRSATTLKLTTKQIVEGVLCSARSLLGEEQRICIASPKTLNIARIGAELGYKHCESHFAYVHRTLTREIAVFKKRKV
jgi:tRNA (guanine10-N2)-dimethyltransferase